MHGWLPIINDTAAWSVIVIWFCGAVCLVLLLTLGISKLCMHVYSHFVVWRVGVPILHTAVREYRERRQGEIPHG